MKDERLYRLYRLHKIDSRLIDIKNQAEHLDIGKRELALAKKLRTESLTDLERHEEVRNRVHQLRTALNQAESKREKFNRDLFSGSVSAKEAENLQREIEMLGDLSVETAIELEEAEAQLAPLTVLVGEVADQIEALTKQASKKRTAAEARHKELQAAFKEVGEKRAAVEAEVEPTLLNAYKSARKRTGNTGMALITEGNQCSECGILIAPKIKESVQLGRTVPCESCGRILFVQAEANAE